MSYQPLVSIVTVVFNGEKHLVQTIESVIGQTYPHIEYIIIDGGSSDGSVGIIKSYQHKLSYWVSENDKGISDAFNKGIAKCSGDIVGIINADDWYETDAVEKVVRAISNHDVAYGDLSYWKEGKKEMTVKGDHHFLKNEMTLNHPTVFVKRNCYTKWGMFSLDYKYAMDYDFLIRVLINHGTFAYVPGVLANMRWEGLSDTYWKKACEELLNIKGKYFPERKFIHRLYYYKQVSAIRLSRFLNKIGFHPIVRFYRSRFSPVEKTF
jgi:glycosyltransferase involved in cell wall biosynthesis